MLLALGLTGAATPNRSSLYQFESLHTKRKTKNLLKTRMSMRSDDYSSHHWWRSSSYITSPVIGLVAVVLMFSSTAAAIDPLEETLSNVPQTLSGECSTPKDCKKARIQHPKSRQAESCTIKCVTTCIRGGDGEGPLNARRPIVVFKQGFRSRQYCYQYHPSNNAPSYIGIAIGATHSLVECSDICNLIKDGEDGP